jgi:putative ABC transport system permease protein
MEFGPITRAMMRNRMRYILIALQIAITFAIVANAVNMIANEQKAMQKESGFDDENLVWVRSKAFSNLFQTREYRIATAQSDVRVLAGIPGVRAAVNTNFVPWVGGGSSGTVKADGGDGTEYRTQVYSATSGLIDTLGVKIVSGRNLRDSDLDLRPEATKSQLIISKALERLMFKGKSAIGQQIDGDTVVGVFDPFYNPYSWPIHEYCIIAPGLATRNGGQYLVRVAPGQMKNVIPLIEKRMLASNDGRNIETKPIAEVRSEYFTQGRIIINLMTAVIVLIIFITGLGIVGVTSFTIAERRKQIGTRRALGATKTAILRYFLAENWLITNGGVAVGIVLAYGLNWLLVTHTSATKLDVKFIVAGVLLLWAQGIIATMLPAMRAAAVPPVLATKGV